MEPRFDPWLLLAVLAILGASLATLNGLEPGLGSPLFLRQLVWCIGGVMTLWLLSRVHLTVYQRLAPFAYAAGMAALLLVLVAGEVRAGTRGWFAVGPLTLQPSELARLTTLLMVASWLSRQGQRRLLVREAAVLAAVVGAPMALILLQPDLGVALTYLPLLLAGLWIGGVPPRVWVVLALVGALGAGLAWQFLLRPYQKERVAILLDPERDPYGSGYQLRQSKIAVGSGGVAGQGLGRGSQSVLRFLPAPHTDFVFAAWAEATGFLGSTLLLGAYALLLGRTGLAAARTESRHGVVLAVLVGSWIAFQVVVNVGMAVGWMPTTGITLPLLSYGGSSLLAVCAGIGLVQSVWRHRMVNL